MIPEHFKDWRLTHQRFLNYMENWYKFVKHTIRSDLDYIEIVSGTEGSGKSTFAIFKMIWLLENAKRELDSGEVEYLPINQHQLKLWEDGDFSSLVQEYIFLSAKDFLHKIWAYRQQRYKNAIIIIDEAGRELFARESMRKVNKLLVKFFITARFLNNIYFLCVPKPKYLDIYIREERANLISWIVLGMDYSWPTPRSKRKLISIPRIAFQVLMEKYGWHWIAINVLSFPSEDSKFAQELNAWRASLPFVGIYDLPPNMATKLKFFYQELMEAYAELKSGEGFAQFLDEVEESLEDE